VGGICGIGEEKLALNTNMIWTTVLSREGGRWDLALTPEALRLFVYFFLNLIGYKGLY
jgi:hypothetical protein